MKNKGTYRGVVSQHSDTRVKNKGTFKGSCFTAVEHACEYHGIKSKTVLALASAIRVT